LGIRSSELPYAKAMVWGLRCVRSEPGAGSRVGRGHDTQFLHKHYPLTRIDVVDIDPVVVEVAKQFFGFAEDATLKAYVQTGGNSSRSGRMLMTSSSWMPLAPRVSPTIWPHESFSKACAGRSRAGDCTRQRLESRLESALRLTWSEHTRRSSTSLYILDRCGTPGNKILIALPRRLRVAREELARRAGAVSRQKQFGSTWADLVTYGYRYADERDPHGQVLTDKSRQPGSAQPARRMARLDGISSSLAWNAAPPEASGIHDPRDYQKG